MPKPNLVQFRALPGKDAVDETAGIISGVSVMTIGPALGHGIDIDRTGLEQCLAACEAWGEEGVKLMFKHDGEMEDAVGVVKDFRIDGDQIRGDVHLFDTAPQRARILELAIKTPKGTGLSVETTGKHEKVPNSKRSLYRCAEIDAIALVPKPAANPTGLFSQVDTSPKTMEPEEIQKAITEGVAAAIAPIEERLSKLENPEKKDDELEDGEEEKGENLSAKRIKEISDSAAAAAVTKFAATIGVKKAPTATDPEASKKNDLTRFEAKVEEYAKLGVRNPYAYAVHKNPDLFEDHCEKKGGR